MSTKMTPQLRFPEFTDEWQVKKLGDIAEFSKGSSISKNDIHENGKIEAIRYGELYTTYNEIIDEAKSKTSLSPNGLKFSKANDVIIPASGETAIDIATASCVLRDNIALSGDLNIIRTQNNGVFMAYLLNNKKKNDIARLAQGVSVIHLYSSNLKDLVLNLPSKPEQEKIADFLTAVDERIGVSEKKLELLETYKRGAMQKIFSQKIRFKDENGKPYPDWEEKKAGALFRNISNRKHNGELPVLSITQDEGVVQRDSLERKINQSDTGVKNYKIIEPNDFVISLRSFQGGIEMSNILGISSPAYTVLRGNSEVIPGMFKHYFKRDEFISKLNSTVIGIRDGKQISYEPFSTIKLPVPYIEEQQKIADFLTTLDDKITAEKSKLTAAREFKKALLQRMFV